MATAKEIFTVQPSSIVYEDLFTTFQTKVLKFDRIEEMFDGYKNLDNPSYYKYDINTQLYVVLKTWFEKAVEVDSLSMLVSRYNYNNNESIYYGNFLNYLTEWFNLSGFQDFSIEDLGTNPGGFVMLNVYYSQYPTAPKFEKEPDFELYKIITETVKLNMTEDQLTEVKIPVISTEFLANNLASAIIDNPYYPLTNSLKSSSLVAKSLKEVSAEPNSSLINQRTCPNAEVAKMTADIVTDWLKSCGFENAWNETKYAGFHTFKVYLDK